MTCDDAFDQLTTPAGLSDPQLADHLARCTRCRAMAETLAPAIELFGDSVTSSATRGSTAAAIARQSAARLTQRVVTRERAGRRRVGAVGALLAAAIGGAACCLLAVRLSGSGEPATASTCPRKSPVATDWMERHSLPVAMACVACHPASGTHLAAPLLKPTAPLGGSL